MKTTEINQSIIGKRCECMFTGMMVKGIITEIKDCKYSVNVKVVFDSPQQWEMICMNTIGHGEENPMSSDLLNISS